MNTTYPLVIPVKLNLDVARAEIAGLRSWLKYLQRERAGVVCRMARLSDRVRKATAHGV